MKWVALVILVSIGTYTAVTLHYRRPGHAYQPHQDNKNRVLTSRLRGAGYQRITAVAEIPADFQPSKGVLGGAPAPTTSEAGGVPEELKQILLDQPRLPPSFTHVRAPGEANRTLPYSLQFTCALPDNKQLLSTTYVYVKEQEMAIVADFETIDGELLARTPESAVRLTVPAGSLHPGTYQVTLVGERQSTRWTLQVD